TAPLVEDVLEAAAALAMSRQRPSPTCVQTLASVWLARSADACAHVSNTPIEQIDVPHAQTMSAQPFNTRKPQFGIVCVSITTAGHIVVASQSWTPVFVSFPQPPPSNAASTV